MSVFAPLLLTGIALFAFSGDDLLASDSSTEAWTRISDVDGVTLFRRADGADLLSFRGEAVINASTTHIIDVLKDNQKASAWMPYVAMKRDVRITSADERVEYTHVDMPWPLQDRYFVNRVKMKEMDQQTLIISVESVDEPTIVESDKICGWIHYSNFTLRQISPQATQMIVEINSDPKGVVPRWIVNIAQRQWPVEFFNGLKRELASRGSIVQSKEIVGDKFTSKSR